MEFGTGCAEPAVYAYSIDGRLFCVAVDAVHGPQVTLWAVLDVPYGPQGNPGVNGLGLVVRVQEVASGVVTRPVMVGRLWPHPGETGSWPPPGHKTH
ncbi:hypothetical protein ACWDYJ_35975 [Streptomyces sp. NPDC003042]